MNPLFMQMMMNPMGIGCMPFMGGFMMPTMCCGSNFMTMPYYQNDNLGFLNTPIFRNTSYDYLLDPNYALQQCQVQWQNGGGFGITQLPGFSFPGFTPAIGLPGVPSVPGVAQQPQKTEAEKEAEKKKEEEAKKPAAKKAQKLNETFAKIKKLAEDKNNKFPEIPEELVKQAEEAMKKETAEEQLAAMKEVMAGISEEVLRKTVLADDNVRNQLRKAGYNFNLSQNKYSLKNNDIKEEDIDNSKRLIKLHSDIVEKKFNELQLICGQLSDQNVARARILGVISSWNDKYKGNEKGILRLIALNLPTGNDAVAKMPAVKECVKTFTEALLLKASDYEGYDKITSARNEVNEKLTLVLQTEPANGFTKANIDKLAAACDKLYARLRMQEAVSVRDYINKNFKYMNEVKSGVINENMVIEETQKDLEAEGVAYPKVNELDETPVTEEIAVQREEVARNYDEEYKDDGKGMLEALEADGTLKKVEGKQNVYQTKAVKADGKVRYFAVADNKVYEVFKKDNKFLMAKEPVEVTAEDITSYSNAVERANKLVDNKALNHVSIPSSRYPIFKATGADEYYIIKDNKFYHLLNVEKIHTKNENNVEKVYVDFKDANKKNVSIHDIAAEDVEEFDDSEIKTKKQADEEKRAREMADVTAVESHTYASINDLEDNTVLDELSQEATGKKGNFVKTKVDGYYFCKEKNRYYKYDVKSGQLKYDSKIKSINEKGYITNERNLCVPVAEVFMDKVYTGVDLINKIQEYGSDFRTLLNGGTSEAEYVKAHRKLNTIISMNNPVYTVNFIKGYQANKCLWSDRGICRQIVTENGIDTGDNKHLLTGTYYVKQIAILMQKVVEETGFDRTSKDYETLCKIAKGELIQDTSCNDSGFGAFEKTTADNLKATAVALDGIIDKIIEAYDKKYSA